MIFFLSLDMTPRLLPYNHIPTNSLAAVDSSNMISEKEIY